MHRHLAGFCRVKRLLIAEIPALLWLLLVNRRAPRLLTHTLPPVLLLLAGLMFFFLRTGTPPRARLRFLPADRLVVALPLAVAIDGGLPAWLLLVNRRAPRLLTHTLPPVLLLLAGLMFFFLKQRRDQADDNSEEDFRRRVEFMHRHLAGFCRVKRRYYGSGWGSLAGCCW
jgi:hypothetical protein